MMPQRENTNAARGRECEKRIGIRIMGCVQIASKAGRGLDGLVGVKSDGEEGEM